LRVYNVFLFYFFIIVVCEHKKPLDKQFITLSEDKVVGLSNILTGATVKLTETNAETEFEITFPEKIPVYIVRLDVKFALVVEMIPKTNSNIPEDRREVFNCDITILIFTFLYKFI